MADQDNAHLGMGTVLAWWNPLASPPAYVPIAAIRRYQPPGVSRPETESTTLDSGGRIERITGNLDGDQFNFRLTMNATSLPLVKGFVEDGVSVDFKTTYPAPTSLSEYFSGVPLGYKPGEVTPEGLVEVEFTGRVTGELSDTDPHA